MSGTLFDGLRAAGLVTVALLAATPGLLAGVTPAAAQAPTTVHTPIDGYPLRQLPTSCSGREQPGPIEWRRILLAGSGGRNSGIYNCASGGTSYHIEGRAFDWGMNAGNAFEAARVNEVLTWLLATDDRGNPHANARRLGIGEIIWNRRILTLWSSTATKQWLPYDCSREGTSCHTDHVHFSFSWAGANKTTGFFTSRAGLPRFALSDSLGSSVSTRPVFGYGFGATEVFSGDWDEDGRDGIGIYDPTTARFHLRNALSGGVADHEIWFGNFGDQPIAGDWDGDGQDDIGVYDPPTQRFHFFMLNGTPAPASIFYGSPGDRPLVGDWNGDGKDEIGVYNPVNRHFYRRLSAGDTRESWIGDPGDVPLTGDWNGDRVSELGVYRPATGYFYFFTSAGQPAGSVHYGDPGNSPIIGDWDGRTGDTQGVVLL